MSLHPLPHRRSRQVLLSASMAAILTSSAVGADSFHDAYGNRFAPSQQVAPSTERVQSHARLISKEVAISQAAHDTLAALFPSQAEEENCRLWTPSATCSTNGQSRIYLGIHWSFDKTEGIAHGRCVADYIFDRTFLATP